jgi:hypothetical protein
MCLGEKKQSGSDRYQQNFKMQERKDWVFSSARVSMQIWLTCTHATPGMGFPLLVSAVSEDSQAESHRGF